MRCGNFTRILDKNRTPGHQDIKAPGYRIAGHQGTRTQDSRTSRHQDTGQQDIKAPGYKDKNTFKVVEEKVK